MSPSPIGSRTRQSSWPASPIPGGAVSRTARAFSASSPWAAFREASPAPWRSPSRSIPPWTAQVELLTNVVSIGDDGQNGPDANPGDNEATETTPVIPPPPPEQARLEVTLVDLLTADADSNGGASAGDTLTYVARITNPSLTEALGVGFTVTPDSLTRPAEDSVSTSQGVVVSGQSPLDGEVTVELGDLSPGAGADVTFDVVLVSDLPPEATQLRVQGLATAGNAPEEPSDDPDTPEDDDPTVTPLLEAEEPAEIPMASDAGLALLVLLLAAGGIAVVRRRTNLTTGTAS